MNASHIYTCSVIDFRIDPVLVHIGPLAVHWYGVMYVVGIVAGLYVALPFAERRGITREQAYSVFWPVLVACLVGGRLYYVVQSNVGWYLRHPQNILATWEGGMAFYGAVFLGFPVLLVAAHRAEVPAAHVLDATALFIPVAQTLGRVGNVINGDILGYRSGAPWAIRYTNPSNTFVPSHSVAYAPAAVYELLFSVGLFLILWNLRDRLAVPGTLFAVWLGLYSAGQILLFFARDNIVVAFGLKQAQVTALCVIVVVVPCWFAWQRSYRRKTSQTIAGKSMTITEAPISSVVPPEGSP